MVLGPVGSLAMSIRDDGRERRRSYDREIGSIDATLQLMREDLVNIRAGIATNAKRIGELEEKAAIGKGVILAAGLALPTMGGLVGAWLSKLGLFFAAPS